MMKNELVAPLQAILHTAEALLQDADASLNPVQSQCARAIYKAGSSLMETIVGFPELNWEMTRQVLNYETRSHLASIIGYAEVLLDEDDGPLTSRQQAHALNIRAGGALLLKRLSSSDSGV
ncbi:MAG: hypothetical protein HXY40_13600 [Chloroflexi bacterium]|nr:hypothetical protein [Chloroflexota bacterium]